MGLGFGFGLGLRLGLGSGVEMGSGLGLRLGLGLGLRAQLALVGRGIHGCALEQLSWLEQQHDASGLVGEDVLRDRRRRARDRFNAT